MYCGRVVGPTMPDHCQGRGGRLPCRGVKCKGFDGVGRGGQGPDGSDILSYGQDELMGFYRTLLACYGPQEWWPGETAFEVMVGAVLTQNTNWNNVERAIANLREGDLLTASALDGISHEALAGRIKPAGYFNIKARRLKNLVRWFCEAYGGQIEQLAEVPQDRLREELLSVNGIGKETADSILLYALGKPTFVVDAYTYRILVRHGCLGAESSYEEVQEYCQSVLPEDRELYNECHALIVRVGKEHCKPRPRCNGCPLEGFEHWVEEG